MICHRHTQRGLTKAFDASAELLHRIQGPCTKRGREKPDKKYALSETVAEEGFDRGQSESGGVIVGVNHCVRPISLRAIPVRR